MRKDIEYGPDNNAEQAPKEHSIVGLIWAAMGRLRRLKRKLTPMLDRALRCRALRGRRGREAGQIGPGTRMHLGKAPSVPAASPTLASS